MKFKGKAPLQGMSNKKEFVSLNGRIIATFENGALETEDVGLIDQLKQLGYESDAPPVEEKKVEALPEEKKEPEKKPEPKRRR